MHDETILCIAPRRWDALWKETQAIMSRLAVRNRVLYFEPGRDPEYGVLAEMRRSWPILFTPINCERQQNLIVIPSPPALPHGRQHLPAGVLQVTMPVVTAINARLLRWHVQRVMRTLAVTSPILWLTDPYHASLVGHFGEKIACYFNFDEFADIVENRRVRALLRRLDDELTQRSDIVFATSRAQWERRKSINPRTYFVPNAVDFELFHRAVTEELPIPADIANVAHPILGFVGWLTNHIDVALLRRISEAYTNCSIVLVGPGRLPGGADLEFLRSRPNVFFLGRKDYRSVPAYLRMFDVALMPYSLIGHVLSAYPAKLHEYLAAGRAVVATAAPELRPYESVVYLAETYDEFIQMIGEALSDRSVEAVDARLAVARDNTWDRRVAEIDHLLGSFLQLCKPSYST
jgi:glycosyltransferase involved in cell wall biosynthesis